MTRVNKPAKRYPARIIRLLAIRLALTTLSTASESVPPFHVKDKLRKLRCSPRVRFKLDQLLDSLEFSEKQVVKTTREIRRYCQTDSQNWRQLKNIRQLGGFLALVPTENSAGERTDRGSTIGFEASSSRLLVGRSAKTQSSGNFSAQCAGLMRAI